MELSAGTHVGPYEIQRPIGAGGMGVVYRANDARLGRSVAIKVLPEALRENPDRLRRFEQEARTIGGLSHPNLVILHDVGHHDGVPYLVTELLDGQSLRERLSEGPLALRDVIRIAGEIARGLAAAHGAGIVHRDIKPDNVFVTADGRVKILDFGIAKLRRDEPEGGAGNASTLGMEATGTGVVIGTPGYMAPEQLAGGAVDARTDLFALGVVIYEMLSRRRPFAAETGVEESYGILKSPPPAPPTSVPPAVAKIVLRCLEKRPDARFQSAADLAFALDALDDLSAGRTATPALGVPAPVSAGAFAATIAPGAPAAVVTTEQTTKPAASVSTIEAPTNVPARAPAVTVPALAGIAAMALLALLVAWVSRAPAPAATSSWSEGGPRYTRVTYRAQQKWFARFAEDGRNVLNSVRSGADWEIVRSAIGEPTVQPVGINGRLLDVSPRGELAIRQPDPNAAGGILARGTIGGAAPRKVTDHVVDASWMPNGELAILRRNEQGNALEYPIGTAIARSTTGELSALRVSRDGKRFAVIEQAADHDARGRVVVFDLAGKELVHSQTYSGIDGIAWSNTDQLWFSVDDTVRELAASSRERGADGHERIVLRSYGRLELRDIDASGRILIAPTDTRLRMFVVTTTKLSRELGWLDESAVKSVSQHGDVTAFLQVTTAGETTEGYAAYVRKHDEAPVQLGNAFSIGLVPDGSAALMIGGGNDPLRIVPTAMGAPRALPPGPITQFDQDDWIAMQADGKHAVIAGAARGGQYRLWLLDLAGAAPIPIGPDSVKHGHHPISPDGAWVAIGAERGITLISTTVTPPRDLPNPLALEPLEFSDDGKTLFVMQAHSYPRTIQAIDLASGVARPLWTIDPPDRPRIFDAVVTSDGTAAVYTLSSEVSDLYVVSP